MPRAIGRTFKADKLSTVGKTTPQIHKSLKSAIASAFKTTRDCGHLANRLPVHFQVYPRRAFERTARNREEF